MTGHLYDNKADFPFGVNGDYYYQELSDALDKAAYLLDDDEYPTKVVRITKYNRETNKEEFVTFVI
jgi:hypothetical protein